MPSLTETLRNYKKDKNLTQKEMAAFLGIGYRTYQSIESTGVAKKISDLDKIYAKIDVPPDDDTQKSDNKIEKEVDKGSSSKSKSDDKITVEIKTNDIAKLIEANYILAEANKIFAQSQLVNNEAGKNFSEAHKLIAESVYSLAAVIKTTPTASGGQQNQEAFSSILRNLQELVVDIATGKQYVSRQEVQSLLYKPHPSQFQEDEA